MINGDWFVSRYINHFVAAFCLIWMMLWVVPAFAQGGDVEGGQTGKSELEAELEIELDADAESEDEPKPKPQSLLDDIWKILLIQRSE